MVLMYPGYIQWCNENISDDEMVHANTGSPPAIHFRKDNSAVSSSRDAKGGIFILRKQAVHYI